MARVRSLSPRTRGGLSTLFESGGPEGPPDRQTRLLRTAPYLLMAAVIVGDWVTPRDVTFSSTLAVAPALAALGTHRPARPLLVGAVAFAIVVGLSAYSRGISGQVEAAAIASVVAVTAVSWGSVIVLRRQQKVLTDVRTVAEAAQHVLLRDIPPELTQVRSAVRYEAAAAEARIGGDLYEAMTTPFGDRLIIGDVRGKGLPAVEAASDVLGIFREAAHQESDLRAVAHRLNAGLARRTMREEDFVTAVLISIPPGKDLVEIVNCGHPSPILLHDGAVITLDPPEPGPPLGLFDLVESGCQAHHAHFEAGDSILLYTDGTTEARDAAGEFYPLTADLAWARFDNPAALADHVLTGLRLHAGARLEDDVALLAVQRIATGQTVLW